MKYLILALLAAFSLPAMAAATAATSATTSAAAATSRGEVAHPTQQAGQKSQTIYQGDAEYKDGEDGVNLKGKPTKEQIERNGPRDVSTGQASGRVGTINNSKSNSFRQTAKCSPMPQCADWPFPPERPPADRLKKLDSRAQ